MIRFELCSGIPFVTNASSCRHFTIKEHADAIKKQLCITITDKFSKKGDVETRIRLNL